MRRDRARFSLLAAGGAVTALTLAACGGGNASTASSTTGHPITVGISLPLTGQFSADGIATEHGYQLWQSDVNANGGLLGRPVQLKIVNDNSNPNTVTKDYTTLITQDHVDLTMAPFSTLLTASAQPVAEKYHYALAAGSATGGGLPEAGSLLLQRQRARRDRDGPVRQLGGGAAARKAAHHRGVPNGERPVRRPAGDGHRGVSVEAWGPDGLPHNLATAPTPNATDSNLIPMANKVAALHPQLVVLGTVDVPSLLAFVNAFKAKGFTPKIMIASSGPDQGEEFLHHIGVSSAQAIMVPDGWYGGEPNALSHVMVQDYIAKFGGTTNDINADVAEAYSAGETLAAAVKATGTLNNTTIERYLHTHTVQTVQGPATFNALGENTKAQGSAFIFQWQNSQFLQVLPTRPGPAALAVKPNWG